MNGSMFETGDTTTPTAFTGGVEGRRFTILIKHAQTMNRSGTNIKGNDGVDTTANAGDMITGIFNRTSYRIQFSDCTS